MDFEFSETGPHDIGDGKRVYLWKVTGTTPDGKTFTHVTADWWSMDDFNEQAARELLVAGWRALLAESLAMA